MAREMKVSESWLQQMKLISKKPQYTKEALKLARQMGPEAGTPPTKTQVVNTIRSAEKHVIWVADGATSAHETSHAPPLRIEQERDQRLTSGETPEFRLPPLRPRGRDFGRPAEEHSLSNANPE